MTAEKKLSRKERILRFFLYLAVGAIPCLIWGMMVGARGRFHEEGFLYAIVPVLIFLIPNLRRGIGFLGLPTFLFFYFLGMALSPMSPVERPIPLGVVELAPLTVNGVNPRTFQEKGALSFLTAERDSKALEAESLSYHWETESGVRFALARLVIRDGVVEDARLHLELQADDLKLPCEDQHGLVERWQLIGSTLEECEAKLSQLSDLALPEPKRGLAILFADDGVVHYGEELAVYGSELYQNTSLLMKLSQEIPQHVRKRLDFSSNYDEDKDLVFRDPEFQVKNIDDSKLFFDLEDQKVVRFWSVYPLPMPLDDGKELQAWSP